LILSRPDGKWGQFFWETGVFVWLRQQIDRVLGLRASDTKRSSKNYADRVLKKLASGASHSTLGNNIKDEAYTRAKAEQWLKVLRDCGLKSDMLCVEYGCGSLWAAEPVIEFLAPGKFIGVDIVDGFYKMGQERIADLASRKRPQFAVITAENLRPIAAQQPKFIYSRKVLSHIAPTDRAEFFALLCSLVSRDTIVVVDSITQASTVERNKGTWSHAIADVKRDLPQGFSLEAAAGELAARRQCYLLRRV
jgi:hypothetical protein